MPTRSRCRCGFGAFTERDIDRYGRVVAVCRTAGELYAAMVRRGWAVDYTHYSGGHYRPEERDARRERLGIWSGRFEMPWEWRADRRAPRGAR